MNKRMRLRIPVVLMALMSMLICSVAGAYSVGYGQSGTYTYDANGRVTSFKTNEGTTLYYSYDRNGNLLKKQKLQILGYLDNPASTDIKSPYLNISGWYLDNSGVESIKVYIDNEYKGTAIYGDKREDVYNAYPGFSNHNSGFHFDAVLPNVSKSYNIKVVARSKAGMETGFEKTVNYTKLLPTGYLDSPIEGENFTYYANQSSSSTNNNMTISGWYLDIASAKSISVYVNGLLRYSGPSDRSYRQDVYNVYPQYNDKNSGFNFTMPKPASRNYGKTISYTLKVVVENSLGEQTEWIRKINVYYEKPVDPGTLS